MASFNTTVRQMTEKFHWPKCLSRKWPKCFSEKNSFKAPSRSKARQADAARLILASQGRRFRVATLD